MAVPATNLGRLSASRSMFFLCDMQVKFRDAIHHFEEIAIISQRLVQAAKFLSIPVVATEQYPKGLGHTDDAIDVSGAKVFEKTKFSMVIPAVEEVMKSEFERKSIVLFGIEAHVCVSQTALDLLEMGYSVHVVADATSSRANSDRNFAFSRLRQSGAFITTSEAVIFELLGDSKAPFFKDVQALVKTSPPDTGLSRM